MTSIYNCSYTHVLAPGSRIDRRHFPIETAVHILAREIDFPFIEWMKEDDRTQYMLYHKQIIIYLLSSAGYTHKSIGEYFGGMHPSSITYTVHRVENDFLTDSYKRHICSWIFNQIIIPRWK